MIEDRQLSPHFTLYALTQTEHADLLEMNRKVDELQIAKLIQVANLWETAWGLLEIPWVISSGYRCPKLNQTVGSSLRSQHLLCEAGDAIPRGMEVAEAFKRLRQAAKDGEIKFGQMIYEKAARGYSGGVVEWVHLSLGYPYRAPEKCGQILTMVDGGYTLIDTIKTD